mmetsp:Transcript_2288/g.4352  ORF Transcript_2288/g.4352 Transcript_2288/m.4352 type:complete len:338 (-) Transcript_2288:430-1443(-)
MKVSVCVLSLTSDSIEDVDDEFVKTIMEEVARLASKTQGKLTSVSLTESSRRITGHAMMSIAKMASHLLSLNIKGCRPEDCKLFDKGVLNVCLAAKGLLHLDVSGCSLDSHTLKEILNESRKLKSFKMNGVIRDFKKKIVINQLSSSFRRLRDLQTLEISSCLARYETLKTILKDTGATLKRLRMAHTVFDGHQLQELLQACEQLEEIDIYACTNVVDEALAYLCKQNPRLRTINVARTLVTDQGIQWLSTEVKGLENLILFDCKKVTDTGIRALVKAKKLRQLDVFGLEDLSDPQTLQLLVSSCPALEKIQCGGCGLVEEFKRGGTLKINQCRILY